MPGVPPKESEVRRLLSKALSRRRRKAAAPGVHNALHLDLNKEFEGPRGGSLKYFFVILMLFALLIFCKPNGRLGEVAGLKNGRHHTASQGNKNSR